MQAENAKMELAHKNNALIKAETDMKISKEIVKKAIFILCLFVRLYPKKRQNGSNRLGKIFFGDLAWSREVILKITNCVQKFLIFVNFWKCAKKYYLIRNFFVCYCFILYKEKMLTFRDTFKSWKRGWERSALKELFLR